MATTIAKAKEYKVQDGDTMQSIADANGVTIAELAKFNFGSDKPDDINKGMRSKVGSIKKAADKKNLIFSSVDDPGILYIPENFPEPSFASNGSHSITVKQIPVKTFIPSKVMVEFRPKTDWKGEFGFDWLRVGDVGEKSYKSIINGGWKGLVDDGTGKMIDENYPTAADAYTALKTKYFKLPTEVKNKKYYVPYLNLYPPSAKGTPAPPTSAELRLFITVEDEEPLKIEFEYHKGIFQLDKQEMSDKAIGAKREASDKTVKITCLEEFDTDQEIKVLAYPKTWKFNDPVPIAGKIIVCANNRSVRKNMKFVLVKVKTKLGVAEKLGTFGGTEKTNLYNTLYQAYIYGQTKNYVNPDDASKSYLDLTADANFKIIGATRGQFVDATSALINHYFPAGGDTALFGYLWDAFRKQPGGDKFDDHFPVFSFGDSGSNNVIGKIQSIGGVFQKKLVLFGNRDNTTLNHEVLHGLKMRHTHRESSATFLPKPEAKFTYVHSETDNVMSYVAVALTTWHWQWKIMRKNV